MSEPKSIWVRSKWQADELDKQLIEFRLALKGGGVVSGIAPMNACSRKLVDDLISVSIEIDEPAGPWKQRQTIFLL